jgi:hypothetical protein
LQAIDHFILIDDDFRKNHPRVTRVQPKTSHFYYVGSLDGREKLIIKYGTANSDYIVFTKEEEERLKDFMKDPELYKNINKYNL